MILCVTGCEHGLATWLSPYGIEQVMRHHTRAHAIVPHHRLVPYRRTRKGHDCFNPNCFACCLLLACLAQGGLSEQRMAFMSSTYWGVMAAGRLMWTMISRVVSSTWPMLFFDVTCCLLSSLLLLLTLVVGQVTRDGYRVVSATRTILHLTPSYR